MKFSAIIAVLTAAAYAAPDASPTEAPELAAIAACAAPCKTETELVGAANCLVAKCSGVLQAISATGLPGAASTSAAAM